MCAFFQIIFYVFQWLFWTMVDHSTHEKEQDNNVYLVHLQLSSDYSVGQETLNLGFHSHGHGWYSNHS